MKYLKKFNEGWTKGSSYKFRELGINESGILFVVKNIIDWNKIKGWLHSNININSIEGLDIQKKYIFDDEFSFFITSSNKHIDLDELESLVYSELSYSGLSDINMDSYTSL